MITSQSVTKGKPQTQLDWAGRPMKEGDYYNGKPEHRGPSAEKKIKGPMTPEKLVMLRGNMAKAREVMLRHKEALRLRREKRRAAKGQAAASDPAKPEQAS